MNNHTFSLALVMALSAATVPQATAWAHRFIHDPWDTSWFDDAIEHQRQAMEEMRSQFHHQFPTKEQQETIKKARENLGKIKLDIKEQDQKIVFTFTGFENLEKKDIDIEKKKFGWIGTIKTKDGTVEFAIGPRGIEVARQAEVKFEEKAPEAPKVAEKEAPQAKAPVKADKKAAKKETATEATQQVFYSSSYTTEAQGFKQPIKIDTLKVDARTGTSLTLSADKIKKEKLHIP